MQSLEHWLSAGSRVLDIGCGCGAWLAELKKSRGIQGIGLDISSAAVASCAQRGVSAIQWDVNRGLAPFHGASFDIVLVKSSLPEFHDPRAVLEEAGKLAPRVIVGVPNFGYLPVRLKLLFRGRMPVSKTLPAQWYDTDNIKLCTFKDLRALAGDLHFQIEDCYLLSAAGKPSRAASLWPNGLAAYCWVVLKSGS